MKLTPITNPVALRLDTTVGTRIFAGTTMIHGDTGWRDIASLLEPYMRLSPAVGMARLRRVGDVVTLRLRVILDSATTPNVARLPLPAGFHTGSFLDLLTFTVAGSGRTIRVNTLSSPSIMDFTRAPYVTTPWDADQLIPIEVSYLTNQGWPALLPGTPA